MMSSERNFWRAAVAGAGTFVTAQQGIVFAQEAGAVWGAVIFLLAIVGLVATVAFLARGLTLQAEGK